MGPSAAPTPAWCVWIAEAERRGFPPLCPDLVVELASPSDTPAELRRKMALYAANGASLGWLLLPESRRVEIWSPASPPRRSEARHLDASSLFPGLVLDLDEIWAA
jgi:Uma2 family endonuclease